MEAIKLSGITEFRPSLSQKDLSDIYKTAVEAIDIYNYEGNRIITISCANGIDIHIEVDYAGFNYRRIALKDVVVGYLDEEKFHELEYYANSLSEMLWDSVYSLNSKEEEEYEYENQYAE